MNNKDLEKSVSQYLDLLNRGSVQTMESGPVIITGCCIAHVDLSSHSDCIKDVRMGLLKTDGAILVVGVNDDSIPQTEELILLAKQIGVPSVLVFEKPFHEDVSVIESFELKKFVLPERLEIPVLEQEENKSLFICCREEIREISRYPFLVELEWFMKTMSGVPP